MSNQTNTNQTEDSNASSNQSGEVVDINGNHDWLSDGNSNNSSNQQSIIKNADIKPKQKAFGFILKKKTTETVQSISSPMSNNINNDTITSIQIEQNNTLKSEEMTTKPPSSGSINKIEEISTTKNSSNDNTANTTDSTNIRSSNSNSNTVNAISDNPSNQSQPQPKEKKTKFSFIKPSSTVSSSPSFISPQPTQSSISKLNNTSSPLSNQSSSSTPIKPKTTKDLSLILDTPYKKYKQETDQNAQIAIKQIRDFKHLFNQLVSIKQEISLETNKKTQLEESIIKLTEKQNSLIEKNNFEEAIKVEEEIKTTTEIIKQTTAVIRLKTETDLHSLKVKMTELFKARIDQFFHYIDSLAQIQTESTEAIYALNETEKVAMENLIKSIEVKTKETDDLHLEYQESLLQIERTEGTYEKLFQEETKELTESMNDLNIQHDNLQNEIKELRRLLEEKEELLQSLSKQIDDCSNEKTAIKAKYITEESYIKLIKTKDTKLNIYNESLQKLSEMESKHLAISNHYNSKLKEISDIIDSINHLKTNIVPKNKLMNDSIEVMKNIDRAEYDKRLQIHQYEKTIEEYLIKINLNNEKIEVLDLQNKRISNDIVSLEANVKNLDEVKKTHVAKKQFKEAQTVTLEIKKYNEKMNSLNDLIKENNKEMQRFKDENELQINQVEALKNLIGNLNDDIIESSQKYTALYINILTALEEELDKLNDKDSALIRNEIEAITALLSKRNENKDNEDKNKDDINETNGYIDEHKDNGETNTKENESNDNNENKDQQITEQTNESTEEHISSIKEPELSIEEINTQINELETKLTQAIEIEDYDTADVINKTIDELKAKVASLQSLPSSDQ